MSSSKGTKRPALPPFARLIAADELGLLKGEPSNAVLEKKDSTIALTQKTFSTVCEVPAGPKWDGTQLVQRWSVVARATHCRVCPKARLLGMQIPLLTLITVLAGVNQIKPG